MLNTLRHERLTGTILEGTVEGRKRQGKQRLEYAKQMTLEIPYNEIRCNEASLLRARHASL